MTTNGPIYEIPVLGDEPAAPTMAPPTMAPPTTPPINTAPPANPGPQYTVLTPPVAAPPAPPVAEAPVAPPAPPETEPGLPPGFYPPPVAAQPIVIPVPVVASPMPPPVAAPQLAPSVPQLGAPQLSAPSLFAAPAPTAPPAFPAPVSTPVLTAPPKEPRVFVSPDSDPDLLAALDKVVDMGGSDLHVTRDATPMVRLHGELRPVPDAVVWDFDKIHAALHSILSPEQLAIFDKEHELDLAYTLSEDARFRVNIYLQRGSMGAAFRLIPTEIKSLGELGVPDTIARFAKLARGLVLVTGPTGSGKSTTLAALIDMVNRERSDHIVTVEDPIEFMHTNKRALVNQREVGSDTHSFNAALKHVLRQDPDVILIGELRDLETISVALTAAETGHLVFATLHTQSAASTIDRVIDVFPPHQQGQVRAQLASTLQGVVCQTLIKHSSGIGRVVATEVMIATPALGNLIREGKTYQVPSAMQAGRDMGMHTMDQHLAELVNAGTITHDAAMEKAQDKEDLMQLIRRDDSASRFAARPLTASH